MKYIIGEQSNVISTLNYAKQFFPTNLTITTKNHIFVNTAVIDENVIFVVLIVFLKEIC